MKIIYFEIRRVHLRTAYFNINQSALNQPFKFLSDYSEEHHTVFESIHSSFVRELIKLYQLNFCFSSNLIVMSSQNRYKCALSEEDLRKAVTELNEPENNEERLKRIDELRVAFCSEDHGLKLIRDDDSFLLRFLRARKFDHNRALKMLINYHTQRQDWPDVFEKVKNPSTIKHVFEEGCFVSIGKAKDGSSVCIGRPGKVDDALFTEFIATLTLSIEHLLEDEKTQIYGVTVIEDFSFMGMQMMQQMGPSIARRFVGWLQDAMPMRVKSVNFVNEPKLFDMLFAIIRPFMKEKLKKRLKAHGSSFNLLHEVIDPAILPPSYGGTGSTLDGEISESWKNAILGEDTYL